METLQSVKERHQALLAKINSLRKNYTTHPKGYNTEAELDRFRADHQSLLDESAKLQENIWQMEFDALSPEEQQKYLEDIEKIKAKGAKHNPNNP